MDLDWGKDDRRIVVPYVTLAYMYVIKPQALHQSIILPSILLSYIGATNG
jgi:hypothetical protein